MIDKKIADFLKKKTDKQKIIVIYWPTASWKTALSIDVATKLDTEIISTDSRQIFKQMDIGTAKITKDEMDWIKHHMIDIINPDTDYSVWEFKNQAEQIISNLIWKWKIPILAWWTWLYIDSLIYDFEIPKVPADWELRKKLEKQAEDFWNEYIYKKLMVLDPEYWKTLHPNNVQYVIRALEIKLLTWKSKSEFIKNKVTKYEILFLTPYDKNREALYNRINKRVDLMFEQWLLEEVKYLLKKYKKTDFWLKTIWYAEVIEYLDWLISLNDAKEKIKQNSRNYAKRQLTWFRKYEK
jgi:tRNA dimethylallyltransferase